VTDITPEAIIQGQPDEPTPYYTWASYVNPDFADGDDPGTTVVGQWGVQIGNMVISRVNGTLCANPVDEPPISTNFDQYLTDYVAAYIAEFNNTATQIVMWDPQTERYVPATPEDERIRHWYKPID
jgi:hypothetical protein